MYAQPVDPFRFVFHLADIFIPFELQLLTRSLTIEKRVHEQTTTAGDAINEPKHNGGDSFIIEL